MKKSALHCFAGLAGTLMGTSTANASSELTTLASFNGVDGATPQGSLTLYAGNLYGATQLGGANNVGTVFELPGAVAGPLSTLATFNTLNGSQPAYGLTVNRSGELYGTTQLGGTAGDGTVFELKAKTPNSVLTLVDFNVVNGSDPQSPLAADGAGNLYGKTLSGGANGDGVVFQLVPGIQALSTLVTFNGTNGSSVSGDIVTDAAGNVYGTTSSGGTYDYGTVFEIAAGTLSFSTLANFNGIDGNAIHGLMVDSGGNLFGTAYHGGANSDGAIFEIAAGTNSITTLATFNGTNGSEPHSGLIEDAAGDLFGTTNLGGPNNYGVVFEVPAGSGTITTVATFNGTDGIDPNPGLISDSAGNLYGTTNSGGANSDGTIFELTGTGFVVPEPTGLAILGVGLAGVCRRRRRSRGCDA